MSPRRVGLERYLQEVERMSAEVDAFEMTTANAEGLLILRRTLDLMREEILHALDTLDR